MKESHRRGSGEGGSAENSEDNSQLQREFGVWHRASAGGVRRASAGLCNSAAAVELVLCAVTKSSQSAVCPHTPHKRSLPGPELFVSRCHGVLLTPLWCF